VVSSGYLWPTLLSFFLFVTVFTAINLDVLSISYIDNRETQTHDATNPPGPLGYQYLTYSEAISFVSTAMFFLNNWLADGLLLYRCYVIYAMNSRAIVLPCLMYLATFVTGSLLIYYQVSQPGCYIWRPTSFNVVVPYSVSVSLNVFLTLMIIARLVLLGRAIQNAMNAPFKISGLYKAVITVLSESSALYAVTFLLWIGTWAAENPLEYFFFPILAQTQAIAPFFIILRVANRRAVTDNVVSGDIGSTHFGPGESTGGIGTFSIIQSASSAGMDGKIHGALGVEVGTTVDLHNNKI